MTTATAWSPGTASTAPTTGSQAATLAFTGQFGAPSTLSDAGEPANSDAVAVDADGDAVVAWSRSDGTDSRIQYSSGP